MADPAARADARRSARKAARQAAKADDRRSARKAARKALAKANARRSARKLTRTFWEEAAKAGMSQADAAPMFDRWRASMEADRSPIADKLPWMTFGAIDFLDGYLQPGMRVFEYGSGGSTLFYLRHGASVVAVEHDQSWGEVVRRAAPAELDLHVCPPTEGEGFESRMSEGSFRDYVTRIDSYGMFDLVVVDGRARNDCMKYGAGHVTPGGMLVLDNSERTPISARRGHPGSARVAAGGFFRTRPVQHVVLDDVGMDTALSSNSAALPPDPG